VADVFGGLAGGGGDDGPAAALSDDEVALLEAVLVGGVLLGAELDPRYRVLALTFEPIEERYAWGPTDDRRIQVLASPVSVILGSLRREHEDGEEGTKELLTFTEEQLVDVVAALDGPEVHGPLFEGMEPRPGEWGPRFSLEGRSSAPDGITRRIRLEVAAGDLTFGLFARFDHVEVRSPAGEDLRLPSRG
jgi:hypothetical protein